MSIEEFPNIKAFFSEAEKEKVRNFPKKDRRHPTNRILFPEDRDRQVATNTDRAIRIINRVNPDWLKAIKPRLLIEKDFQEPSATFGEIRALGYLLEAGLEATPPEAKRDQKRPEFVLNFEGKKVLVEVQSKQMNAEEAKALEEFNNRKPDVPKKPGVYFSQITVVTPFGKPKENECVTENVIQKLAQIKKDESQVSDTEPSLLWLDFQDESWDLVIKPDSARPLRTWNGEFCSGEFWHSMYGWKGAPIYEGSFAVIEMPHEGKFNQNSKFDAVMFSLSNCVFLFQNCNSKKPLPDGLVQGFLRIPWFSYSHSQVDWPDKTLKARIDLEKARILALKDKIDYIRYVDATGKKSYPDGSDIVVSAPVGTPAA